MRKLLFALSATMLFQGCAATASRQAAADERLARIEARLDEIALRLGAVDTARLDERAIAAALTMVKNARRAAALDRLSELYLEIKGLESEGAASTLPLLQEKRARLEGLLADAAYLEPFEEEEQ